MPRRHGSYKTRDQMIFVLAQDNAILEQRARHWEREAHRQARILGEVRDRGDALVARLEALELACTHLRRKRVVIKWAMSFALTMLGFSIGTALALYLAQ